MPGTRVQRDYKGGRTGECACLQGRGPLYHHCLPTGGTGWVLQRSGSELVKGANFSLGPGFFVVYVFNKVTGCPIK